MELFDLASLPQPVRSRVLTRVVAPRPIAFVSSRGAGGAGNLAPFSFFMLGGSAPASCVISPTFDRTGTTKHTLDNIRETGEYVINVVTRTMADRVNQASFSYPKDVDEFDAAGFTRVPSVRVSPPRVGESPIQMECRVHQIVPHGTGPGAASYVIGEVLVIHADPAVCVDGLPDERHMDLVARAGADRWVTVRRDNYFDLPRPATG